MKNRFLQLFIATFAIAILALAILPIPIRAEVGTQSVTVTNLAASATQTVNLGGSVKVDNQDTVGLLFSGQGSDVDTGNITVTVVRSADGTTWETTPKFAFTFAANGTNIVNAYTNMTSTVLGSAGHIKLLSVQNAATNTFTNCTLTVVFKKIR